MREAFVETLKKPKVENAEKTLNENEKELQSENEYHKYIEKMQKEGKPLPAGETLNRDAKEMEEAAKAGLEVGVYFYSQAINVAEAIEEAKYVLGQVEGYQIALPIMYDWEIPEGAPEARTNGLDPSIIGDCGVAFCETIRAAGYEAGIYFTRQLGYYSIDLGRLRDCTLWLADWETDYPGFYYAGNIWQYSQEGEVAGIEGPVDLNLMFIKRPEPAPVPEASPQP